MNLYVYYACKQKKIIFEYMKKKLGFDGVCESDPYILLKSKIKNKI